jgi:hypothetical protein
VDDFEGDDIAAQVRFRDAESLAARLGLHWARDQRLEPTPAARRVSCAAGCVRTGTSSRASRERCSPRAMATCRIPGRRVGHVVELNAGVMRQPGRNTAWYANPGYQRSFAGNRFDARDGKPGVRWNW